MVITSSNHPSVSKNPFHEALRMAAAQHIGPQTLPEFVGARKHLFITPRVAVHYIAAYLRPITHPTPMNTYHRKPRHLGLCFSPRCSHPMISTDPVVP